MRKLIFSSSAVINCIITAALCIISLNSYGQEILYGLTQNGGMYGNGVPYKINTDGTDYFSFRDFDGDLGGHPGNGAALVQQISRRLDVSKFSVRGLVALTELGDQGLGYKVLLWPKEAGLVTSPQFHFTANSSGTNPTGRLLSTQDGTLYGLTSKNGRYGMGAVISVQDITNSPAGLESFNGLNGRSPKGSLIRGIDGKLYGTTEFGGVNDLGVVFSYNYTSGQWLLKKLFDFDGASNGSNPTGNLTLAPDRRLYGMTKNGGAHGGGVIFSIKHDGSGFLKLLDLNGQVTGSNPNGSLTLFTDGKFYGMTSAGGAYGYGTIFSITMTGDFNKIYDFDGPNGKSPVGDLLVDVSGTAMYGVAYAGGVNDKGVLFKLQNGNQFSKLYDYSIKTGSNPVGTLTMMKSESDIAILPIEEKTTISPPFEASVVTSLDMPVYLVSQDTTVVAVRNNKLYPKRWGGSLITAYHFGNHAYLEGSSTTQVMVNRAPQTITFPEIPPKTFGDAPFDLAATSTSGLPVQFNISDPGIIKINENGKATITGAGWVVITAYRQADNMYEAAQPVKQELYIERAQQAITIQPVGPQICCQSFYVSAKSSANLEVLVRAVDGRKLQMVGSSVQPLEIGTSEIVAYHSGNKNYKPAEARTIVDIRKGHNTIYFNVGGSYKFGDPPAYIGPGAANGLPILYTSDPPGIAAVENGRLYFLATGTTTITATQPGNQLYYDATPVSRTITVNPPTTAVTGNTITWADFGNKTMAAPPFNLIAVASSGLPVSYTSSNPSVAEVIGNMVTIKGEGVATITASQAGKSGVVAAAPVSKVLQITKAPQYLSLPSMPSVAFGSPPLALPAKTFEGLPITYTLSTSTIGYIENYNLYITGTGYLTITASQPGNEKYQAAQSVSTSLTISPIYDVVFFKELSVLTYGDPSLELEATSGSGAPVTFSSSDQDIATVNGNTLSVHAAGTVTITASTVSKGYRFSTKERTLIIRKREQEISFQSLPEKKFGDPPFAIRASSSSKFPVAFSTTTPGVIRINGNIVTTLGTGTAEITASQPGDDNHEPAAAVSQKFLVTDAGISFDIIGTASKGGPNQSGVVFSLDSDGKGYGILKHFAAINSPRPEGGLIKGSDGRLYGCFSRGGEGNAGRIIRLEADGTGLTVLHHFKVTDGEYPAGNLIQGVDGNLYGATAGGGSLDGGTVFGIKPDGTEFRVLQNLGPLTGRSPKGVTQGNDGKLYGVTSSDGFYNQGTIFSINPDGSSFVVIFHFNNYGTVRTGDSPIAELAVGLDGFLYGATNQGASDAKQGGLFKIRPDGSDFTKIVEFNRPVTGAYVSAILFGSDGKIYGSTATGGANASGSLFSVNPNGTDFSQIFSFDGANTGSVPSGKLMEGSDGALYGQTNEGGMNGRGTIFRINKNGTGFHKMVDLNEDASFSYRGSLVESSPGNFFGMTAGGGPVGGGAIFKITSGDILTVLQHFIEGESTPSNLIVDPSGEYYYGITERGGPQGRGCIFKMKVSDTSYECIYEVPKSELVSTIFYSSTGHIWVSGLNAIENFMFRMKPDGSAIQQITAYKTALAGQRKPVKTMVETPGGEIFAGTDGNRSTPIFFKIRNDGTGFTNLFSLGSSDRINGNLLYSSDGNFYVSYRNDGIFKFTPSGTVTKIFSNLPGTVAPTVDKIIEMNGGRLGIVTRVNGSGGYGTIFSIEKDGSSYKKIYEVKPTDGTGPIDMLQSVDGWLYVASEWGGTHGKGVVYKIRPDGSSFTKIREFNGDDGYMLNRIFFRKAPQSLGFKLEPEKKISEPPFFPMVTSNSGAAVHLHSSNPEVAKIENGQIKPVAKGTTVITASLPENANFYAAIPVEQTLVVIKGDQTITFESLPAKRLGDEAFDLNATSTSGLTVVYTSSNPGVASIAGSTVTIHGAGSTTITASNPGNDDFFSASVSQVLIVAATQVIIFPNPGAKVLGAAPFQLVATASSSLPVVYTTTSDKIILSENLVTMLKAGPVAIQATQAGNTNFAPAVPVEMSFCINPAKPVITESGETPDLALHSSSETGNQWYFNNSLMTGYTSKSISISEEGSYSVRTFVEGCESEMSDPKLFILTAIGENLSLQINVFPNPAESALNVEVSRNYNREVAVELFDSMGRKLEARTTSGGTTAFDLSSYNNGIMLLKLTMNGKVIMKKFLKK